MFPCAPTDIEAQILEIQGMKASLLEDGEQGVGLISTGVFDPEIYEGSDSRFAGYVTSIAANEQEEASIWFFVCFFPFSKSNKVASSKNAVLWATGCPLSVL